MVGFVGSVVVSTTVLDTVGVDTDSVGMTVKLVVFSTGAGWIHPAPRDNNNNVVIKISAM